MLFNSNLGRSHQCAYGHFASCCVCKFLKEENGIERMEWPARSPDCNPIENLWDIIKRKASKKVKDDTSLQEFQRILQRAWANIEQRQVQTLVNSVRKRWRLVIEADGGHINY